MGSRTATLAEITDYLTKSQTSEVKSLTFTYAALPSGATNITYTFSGKYHPGYQNKWVAPDWFKFKASPNGAAIVEYGAGINDHTWSVTSGISIKAGDSSTTIYYQWATGASSGASSSDKGFVKLQDLQLTISYSEEYSVTTAAGTGGSLSASPTKAAPGSTITLTPSANTGYSFKDYTKNPSTLAITNNKFTLPSQNVSITANFTHNLYALTKSVGANGSLSLKKSGSEVSSAYYGDTVHVLATPNTGYYVSTLKWDGTSITNDTDQTMPAKALTVQALFSKVDYTITKDAGTGGSISVTKGGSSVAKANYGDTLVITATPNTGYQLSSLTFDGNDMTSGGSKSMPAKNITVKATFSKINYTLTSNAGTGGSITIKKGTTVVSTANYGDTLTISATPSTGYSLSSLTFDGTAMTSGGTKSMPAKNVTVAATFAKIDYTITKSAGTGGSISVKKGTSEVGSANYGDSLVVSASPSTGYKLTELKFNGTAITSGSTQTMPAKNITVSATFVKVDYGITKSPGTGGSISVKKNNTEVSSAQYQDSLVVSATASSGYTLSELKFNGTAITSGSTQTMPAKAITVSATFSANTYTITKNAGTGGSISVKQNNVEVGSAKYGTSVVVTATPNTYYALSSLTFNGTTITSGSTQTIPAGNVTIVATFVQTFTPCGAPTSTSLSATVVENNANLSWSGATGGVNNSITDYEIQYADSENGSTWGSWNAFTTTANSSCSVTPPTTRGHYRKFRIRARGSAGSSFYSDWKETGSIRKNVLPSVPSNLSASPTILGTGSITLSWSASAKGTSNLSGYGISYAINTTDSWEGATYSAETVVNSLTVSYAPVLERGRYIKYRVRALDALGAASDYAYFTTVRRNVLPGAPGNLSVTPALFEEKSLDVSWDASTAGTSTITKYRVEICISNSQTFNAYSLYQEVTGTSLTVVPNTSRGQYVSIRVCAVDSLGEYSAYSVGTTARMNSLPTVPGNVRVSQTRYESGSISILWNASTDPDGNLAGYKIQSCTSINGTSWTEWTDLSTTTGTSYAVSPSIERGSYIKYRVRAYDSLDASSAYVETAAVRKNILPADPVITIPVSNVRKAFNPRPAFQLAFTKDENGDRKYLEYKVTKGSTTVIDWTQATTIMTEGGTFVIRPSSDLTDANNYTFYARMRNEVGTIKCYSNEVSVTFSVGSPNWERTISSGDIISEPGDSWSDEILISTAGAWNGETFIGDAESSWSGQTFVSGAEGISHVAEINEMLGYVNERREWFSLDPVAFTTEVGYYKNWLPQMNFMAEAMMECYRLINATPALPDQEDQYPVAATLNTVRALIEGV